MELNDSGFHIDRKLHPVIDSRVQSANDEKVQDYKWSATAASTLIIFTDFLALAYTT
jgi:hypothetical protein